VTLPPEMMDVPRRVDVRVVGATCIPEVPCTLLVDVGIPPAEISLDPTPSVEPVGEPAAQLAEADVVTLGARVHGPEAETALRFSSGSVELGRRALRLPVALGEVQLETSAFAQLGAPPSVRVLGAPRGRAVIIDAFEDGRWVYTHALPAGALDTPRALLGFRYQREVPYRLQARTDLFDSNAAASRYVHVSRSPSEPPLRDPRVAPPAEPRALALERRASAFYIASLDADRLATPVPVSGRAAAIERAERGRAQVRVLSTVALLILGALLVLMVLARGLRASREARAILREAGDVDAENAAHRRRDTLAVLAIVFAIVLVCIAAVVFVLARLAATAG
jgi:hypothetical protein